MKRFLRHYATWLLLGLGLVNVVALLNVDLWHLGAAFAGAYALIVPGLLLLSFLTKRQLPLPLGLALSGALSIALLMAAGLFINTVIPWLGVERPLQQIGLTLAFDNLVTLLIGLSVWRRRALPIELPNFSQLDSAVAGGALLMPALAVLGATSLNNGGSNAFTMASLGLIAGYVPLLVLLKKRLNVAVLPLVLYLMALTLLLMNSMRGWFITGHDVLREYHVFQLTDAADRWNIAAFRDPYNACLSITLLPTYLQSFLHIDPAYIYKFVFQFIGALPIVPIFYLFRRYSSSVIAFLASFTYISFPAFMIDMSMLNRQSAAFLFSSLLLYVLLTNYYIVKRQRTVLLVLLGAGMIVSHYSTSYVAVTMLAAGYVIAVTLRWLMRRRWAVVKMSLARVRNAAVYRQPALLTLPLAIVMLLFAAAWNGPATQTSRGITTTIDQIADSVQKPFGQAASIPQAGAAQYNLAVTDAAAASSFERFRIEGIQNERTPDTLSNLFPFQLATNERYAAQALDEPLVPTAGFGSAVQDVLPLSLSGVFAMTKQSYAALLQVLLAVGLIGLAIGYTFKRKLERRLPLEYIALAVAGLGMIAFQVLVPQSGIDYGVLRLFQQNLMLLALPVVLGFLWLIGFVVRRLQRQLALYGVLLVGFFVVLSGFVPQLIGGGRPVLALNNGGFYYDAYYTHASEVASFEWLKATATNPHYSIQSDRFFTALKLHAYTSIPGGGSRLLPETIKQNSFVLLSSTNLRDGTVVEYQNGDIVYYHLPPAFLHDNKNQIYSTRGSAVYW